MVLFMDDNDRFLLAIEKIAEKATSRTMKEMDLGSSHFIFISSVQSTPIPPQKKPLGPGKPLGQRTHGSSSCNDVHTRTQVRLW